MNVASLDLCRELYELSGWAPGNDSPHWAKSNYSGSWCVIPTRNYTSHEYPDEPGAGQYYDRTVAYDLSYLLRKLPPYFKYDSGDTVFLSLGPGAENEHSADETWFISYTMANSVTPNHPGKRYEYDIEADSPEDAAAQLAIELFEQGILTRESAV